MYKREQMITLNINNIKTLDAVEETIEIGRNKNILDNIEIFNNENSNVNIFFKKEKAISRKHCEIFKQDSQWLVIDKKSTNGTFLNGKRVQTSCKLKDGDKLSLGKETFIFIQIEDDSEHTIFEQDIEVEEKTSLVDMEEEFDNHLKTRVFIEEDTINIIELSPSTMLNRGQYQVIKPLGTSNNFSFTYLAKDIQLGSHVAIKEYFPQKHATRDQENRVIPTNQSDFNLRYKAFKDEAKMVANLPKHPNIINIKNFFEENNTLYYVMDYIQGDSLESYLSKNHPFTQQSIEAIIFPLLEGVKHIHQHNILHRDIKLSNIMMCRNGNPILINFDTVKEKPNSRREHFHTKEYKAIEQLTGAKEEEYTDIYALGMVIYALINGIVNEKELPSSKQRLNILKTQGDAPLNFYNKKKFSKNFINAVEKALEIQPQKRPQTVEEFTNLLKNQKKGLFNWFF